MQEPTAQVMARTPRLSVLSADGKRSHRLRKNSQFNFDYLQEEEAVQRSLQQSVCRWLKTHMSIDMDPNHFMDELKSGVVLCRILEKAVDSVDLGYNKRAEPGSVRARENITMFLYQYSTLAPIPPLSFSPDDLIQEEDPKAVLHCFVDLVQFASEVLSLDPIQLDASLVQLRRMSKRASSTIESHQVFHSNSNAVRTTIDEDNQLDAGSPIVHRNPDVRDDSNRDNEINPEELKNQETIDALVEHKTIMERSFDFRLDLSGDENNELNHSNLSPLHQNGGVAAGAIDEITNQSEIQLGIPDREDEFSARLHSCEGCDTYRLRLPHSAHLQVMHELYELLYTMDQSSCAIQPSLCNLVEDCMQNHDSILDALKPPLFPLKSQSLDTNASTSSASIAPIIDIQIVQLYKGEKVPNGYELILEQGGKSNLQHNNALNMNMGSPRSDRTIALAIKRSFTGHPITDCIICDDDSPIPYGFERIEYTTCGLSANLNFGTGGDALYLCVRRGEGCPILNLGVFIPMDQRHENESMIVDSKLIPQFITISGEYLPYERIVYLTPTCRSASLNRGNHGIAMYLKFQCDLWHPLKRLEKLIHRDFQAHRIGLDDLSPEKAQDMYFSKSFMCIIACCMSNNEVIVRHSLLALLHLCTRPEFIPSSRPLNIVLQTLLELTMSTLLCCYKQGRNLHQIVLKVCRQICIDNTPLISIKTMSLLLELGMIWCEIDKEFNICQSVIDSIVDYSSIRATCSCRGSGDDKLRFNRLKKCLNCQSKALSVLRPELWIRDKIVRDLIDNVVMVKSMERQLNSILQFDIVDNDCRARIETLTKSLLYDHNPSRDVNGVSQRIHTIPPQLLSSSMLIYCTFLNEPFDNETTTTKNSLSSSSLFNNDVIMNRKNRVLDQLIRIIEENDAFFKSSSSTLFLLSRCLCNSLLECVSMSVSCRPLFQRLLKMFIILYKGYRSELKMEVGVFLDYVLCEMLTSRHCSTVQKMDIVESLEMLFNSSQQLVNLFYNFDNSTFLHAYAHMIEALAQIADDPTTSSLSLSSKNQNNNNNSSQILEKSLSSRSTSDAISGSDKKIIMRSRIREQQALSQLSMEVLSRFLEMLSRWLVGKVSMQQQSPLSSSSLQRETNVQTSSTSPSRVNNSLLKAPGDGEALETRVRRKSSWRDRFEINSNEQKIQEKALVLARTTSIEAAIAYLILIRRTSIDSQQQNHRHKIDFRELASFLHRNSTSLDPLQFGKFISTKFVAGGMDSILSLTDFEELRAAYLDLLDFTGLTFDRALRTYLRDSGFWVPTLREDAASCACLIQMFAHGYVRDNPLVFVNTTIAEYFAMTILKLDTQLHVELMKINRETWIKEAHANWSKLHDHFLEARHVIVENENEQNDHLALPAPSPVIRTTDTRCHGSFLQISPESPPNHLAISPLSSVRSIESTSSWVLRVDAQVPSLQELGAVYDAIAKEALERRSRHVKYDRMASVSQGNTHQIQLQLMKEVDVAAHKAMALLRSQALFRRPFVSTTSWSIVHAMMSVTWFHFLASFSGFIERYVVQSIHKRTMKKSARAPYASSNTAIASIGATDTIDGSSMHSSQVHDVLVTCINGLMHGVVVSSLLRMNNETDGFLSVLAKITFLQNASNIDEDQQKRAIIDGSFMMQPWIQEFKSLSAPKPKRACDHLAEVVQSVRAQLQSSQKIGQEAHIELTFSTNIVLKQTNRQLLKQDNLVKLSSNSRRLECVFYLFNDVLLYGRAVHGVLKKPKVIHLAKCKVFDVEDVARAEYAGACPFRLGTLKKDLFILADTERQKKSWIETLDAAIKTTARLHQIRINSIKEHPGSKVAESDCCAICLRGFTIINRRQTCARCNLLICGNCVAKRPLDEIPSKPSQALKQKPKKLVKTCDACFGTSRHQPSFRASVFSSPLANRN